MKLTSEQIAGIGVTSQRSRDAMVQRLIEQGITNRQLLNTMAYMPRHLFIEEAFNYLSYKNQPVPLSMGQTISQPIIVASMTEEILKLDAQKVLEIGTGSGYQAAILAHLGLEVFSIERIEQLHKKAAKTLAALHLNVNLKHGDGYLGWEEESPFDAIIITAAAPELPKKLTEQLKINGAMVLPLEEDARQLLCTFKRTEKGLEKQLLAEVRFVPMLSGVVND